MRDHSNHIVLTKEEAVARAIQAAAFKPKTEHVDVADALGRVLTEDVCSLIQHPSKLSSRMDSVALHWDEISEGIPADTSEWRRGVEWDFANTGCPLPDGFDTALRIEEVEITTAADGSARIAFIGSAPKAKGDGTSAPGSKLQVGDLLAPAGSVLTPLLLATIVSGGHTQVPVAAKPRVGFLPTGNELVSPGSNPPSGKTIDTNSTLLSGMITQWGGIPACHEIILDNYDLIKSTLLEMVRENDIVVINAGSSKGSDDWTMEILDEIGTVINHETNHAPSRHSAYAVVEGTIVVGISGPAGGAAFTSEFYLKPLINAFIGLEPYAPKVTARLTEAFSGGPRPHGGPGKQGPSNPKGQSFFVIQHMILEHDEIGQLTARPVPMGKVLQVNQCRAYYALCRDVDVLPPQVGDLIEVSLRWPYKQGE